MRHIKKLFVYCALFNPLRAFGMSGNSTSFQLREGNVSGLMCPVNNHLLQFLDDIACR